LQKTASRNLISFTEATFPGYRTAPHHRQIARQLERVEKGEIDRLMLLVPPRHGKSELASRRFPAWYLGRHPERQFISCSASILLAEDFGRDVRNLMMSQEYAQIFDTRLAEDSMARGRWNTQAGGSYFATGIGGAIMGRGAHVLLIDDPFGSMAEARSEMERKQVWSWFTGTAYNRLEHKGAIVIINHRMHESDLSGMLLEQQAAGGDRWEVVKLKAIDDAGEALWPDKYPVEALERIRLNTTPADWSALYLQNPIPDEGQLFKAEWLKSYDAVPDLETLNVYGGSDFAVTADGGDFTCHAVLGVDRSDNLFVLDIWRKQASSHTWVETWCDLVLKWKPLKWSFEKGQILGGVGPFLTQRARERRAYCGIEHIPVGRRDKPTRAQSIIGRIGLLGLRIPRNATWAADLRAELLAFPSGRHDDQVDALALIGQLLDMVPGRREIRFELPKLAPQGGYSEKGNGGYPSILTL
jgi:predicted phage terminase large subunit-like protein